MKNLIAVLLIVSHLFTVTAYAECDFATGIEKLPDGRFVYSKECHQKVGKMQADLKDREEQVAALTKTIDLKNLQIQTQEQRAQLWMDTSIKLEDRINTIDRMRSTNQFLYFGLGLVTAGLAVYGASKLK